MKCPQCKNVMIPRKGRNGEFWGCSAFPSCKFTVDGPCDEKDIEEVVEIKRPPGMEPVEEKDNDIDKEILGVVKDMQRQMKVLIQMITKLTQGVRKNEESEIQF